MADPAWNDDDRALVLALAAYEDLFCDGCGLPKDAVWFRWDDVALEHVATCVGCGAWHDHRKANPKQSNAEKYRLVHRPVIQPDPTE